MQRNLKIFLYSGFLILVSATKTGAQSIGNTINLYGSNFPQEKIYIHFDKEAYLPGETVWFKAYLFEENLPSVRSTNFYAALYDEEGELVQQHTSPIFNSTTDGHFTIPDSLGSKQLICRAYTTWMLNFDTSFLFTKAIKLINSKAKSDDAKTVKKLGLQFFPEGGDIIEGTRNTIAFKANYDNGLPFEVSGSIKKQGTGEVVMPLKAEHNGMGRFDLEIQANEKFYLEWADNNGVTQQTYLPKAKPVGVSLKLAQLKDRLIFNIVNRLPNDSLHVLMYMYQKVFYQTHLSVSQAEPYTGMVPIQSLPAGVMQLTVFDANWQPVAERVAFINNNNFTIPTTINNKETSTQKRGKNIIEIALTDTMPANMSLSITDAELNNEKMNSTIVTHLLLSGDVTGYIHEPAYYFTDNTDATLRSRLDLVMLTHGWRRYNWNDMLVQRMPSINYSADNYLSVHGQVGKEVMAKMTPEEIVNLIIKTKDSTNNFYSLRPDASGLLKQSGLIFYDTARVLFSFNKNKTWNTQMAFSSFNYTYPQPFVLNNSRSYLIPDTTGYVKLNQAASLFSYYSTNKEGLQGNEKTLQTVVVSGTRNWRNDPIQKMEEKYTTGMFRGGTNAEAFDLLHDETAESQDIYNYLGYRSRILSIKYLNGGKLLVGPIMGQREKGEPLIYINERIADYSELESVWIYDIAFVKIVYPYFGAREGGDIKTAISIYLKKGDDLIDRRPKATDLRMVKVSGYSPIKEFYSPDYSVTNTTMGTDARTTLLWLPYILTNAKNLKVPVTFFNNDLTKKMRVVLEGINEEGKMIHMEKIIE